MDHYLVTRDMGAFILLISTDMKLLKINAEI